MLAPGQVPLSRAPGHRSPRHQTLAYRGGATLLPADVAGTVLPTDADIASTATGGAAPVVSVVIPAFFEEGNLHKLHGELEHALRPLCLEWEAVIVDDGSADRTWMEIMALHERDPRVKGLRLSRNFGHQYALFAGLAYASGRAIVMMDADLQHPPAVVPRLVQEWRRGARIVHTHRVDHDSVPLPKRIASSLFYRVFSFLSGVHLSAGMADFRLMDRVVVDQILRMREGGLFLRGLVHWVGFDSSKVTFRSDGRFAGTSKYNWRRMLKFAWTGITSFSIIPLRLGILLGLLTSAFAFYQLAEALYAKLVTGNVVPGWASVMGVMSLLFGVLFILLGILGEYLSRVLEEVRGRPRFIVSDSVGLPRKRDGEPGTSRHGEVWEGGHRDSSPVAHQ